MDTLNNLISKFKQEIQKKFWVDKSVQKIYNDIIQQITTIQIPNDKEKFKQENIFILYKLYDTFLGHYASERIHKDNRNHMHKILYSFYNKIGIFKPKIYFNYIPTKVFDNFIKGISYFENENPTEKPAYHRQASCGSSIIESDIKFNSETSKQMVKKCYIERLIYNELYEHFLHQQNISHIRELKRISMFYFTYFPDDNILIKIKYNKFFYPYQLIIKEKKKYGTILEVYTKDWKKEIVICQLMINILNNNLNLKNSNNKKFYSKINTFKEEALWKPIKQKTVDFGKNYRP